MAAHSSILSLKVPIDRSLGAQRVGHDGATKHSTTQFLFSEMSANIFHDFSKCFFFSFLLLNLRVIFSKFCNISC